MGDLLLMVREVLQRFDQVVKLFAQPGQFSDFREVARREIFAADAAFRTGLRKKQATISCRRT
ncbi:hypothetical protein BMG00_16240 [Thioclava marina]|uniref:Uncharacterized protein n=1 Tax=Thioclava marina TaxID=1915077 RepID=A0ABX3MI88_9RHOB|nr:MULTISPECIES: hypothetical protein [Thioclava]OOY11275.1 hypothetical protein BMG00_16240 [Thioclava marina]OOY26988.1 hypothetical protein BMI90_14835 [Thioclava sp. L04-15]TNE87770.1 MAG: hypothetical protein EP337_10600 [Paracoccaceae bacterium]